MCDATFGRMTLVPSWEGRGKLFPWPNDVAPLFDEVAALAISADVEFILNNTGMEYVVLG